MANKVKTVTLFFATLVVVGFMTSCQKEEEPKVDMQKVPETKQKAQKSLSHPKDTVDTKNKVVWESRLDDKEIEQGYLILEIKIPSKVGNDLKIHSLEGKEDVNIEGQWWITGAGLKEEDGEILNLSTKDNSFTITQNDPNIKKPEGNFIYLRYRYNLSHSFNPKDKPKWQIKDQWIRGSVRYQTYADPLALNTYPKLPKKEKTPVPIEN